jgi:hypothetical protein
MRDYRDLGEDERNLLAGEVLRLHRQGIRDQFVDMFSSEGEMVDEDELRQVVEDCTTPGEVMNVPQIGPPDPQAIARGKDSYFLLGCDKCHGEDGAGAREILLFDDRGRPTRPRDLVHEPFKGGQEPKSIYLRIAVGMPGTPHPAAWNLPHEQLIDLVQYCRSLSREPKRLLTNHQQAIMASSRAYLAIFGRSAKVE